MFCQKFGKGFFRRSDSIKLLPGKVTILIGQKKKLVLKNNNKKEKAMHNTDFEKVYEEYYWKVYYYVLKKINNQYMAEDLTQEIFVSCYKNYEKYNPKKAKISTWIYVIVNNKLKNFYRDTKDIVSLDNKDIQMLEDDSKKNLEEAILLEEKRNILYNALDELEERERLIVKKRYFEKKSSSEIAESLGLSSSNVRVILNRTLKKLRIVFEEYGFIEGD